MVVEKLIFPVLVAIFSSLAIGLWKRTVADRSELIREQADIPLRDPLKAPAERRSTLTRSFVTFRNASGDFPGNRTGGKTICPQDIHAPLKIRVSPPGQVVGEPRVVKCPNPDFPPVLELTGPHEFTLAKESMHLNPGESIVVQVDVRNPLLANGRVGMEVTATITGVSAPVDVGLKTTRTNRRMLTSLVVAFVSLSLLTVLYGLLPEHRGLTAIAMQITAYLGIFAICRHPMSDMYRDVGAAWTVSKEGDASLWSALRDPQSDPSTKRPIRRAAEFVVMCVALVAGLATIYYAYL
jgi:hypothetical protein